MADKGKPDFGKRRQVSVPPSPQPPSPKRSNHVALLVMGTLAVGGSAYALMPRECTPAAPGATPGVSTPSGCPTRSSSSGGYSGSRYSYFSGGSSASTPATTSDAGSRGIWRGGFGGFANAVGAHFRGG